MGAGRSLTNKIIPSAVAIAKINAAKPARSVKYMHVGERLRYLARLQGAAKLKQPNRAS